MQKWIGHDDVYAAGYIGSDWADGIFKGRIEKTGTSDYCFVSDNPWRFQAPCDGGRVYFKNVFEEIDSPSEWYLDRTDGILYLYPPENISENADIKFTVNSGESIFKINNASNITIEGIGFDSVGRGAVIVNNSDCVNISNCEFNNILSGVINFYNCSNCTADGNYMHDISGNAIYANGGDSESLKAGNNRIINNTVIRFDNERKCCVPAISTGGVGNVISDNKISYGPHQAIGISGQRNIIENNIIDSVCLETADSGALYGGGTFEAPGNVIRGNYFKNIKNLIGRGYANNSVYLDDMFSSAEVYSNTFYNCQRAALFGGGRGNSFVENTVVDCDASITVDARGTDKNSLWKDTAKNHVSNLEKNMPFYRNEIWAEAFPLLYNIKTDMPEYPKYNTVGNNILCNSPLAEIAPEAVEYGSIFEDKTVSKNDFLDYNREVFILK